ncbi:response regulator transcription factor [Aliikangiella coralliicola]|uniref:Response regulator transcription factor n=1 Tax=Aliikangiella coralliicola TaxID=2592383 RepID=A0A545UE43_9GAMM|nr:response regulator transcription factor [Aliikangiella coralliicola]TQV87736.1 response regulator transcription factor [Aliikangiella coralliicola]
MNNIIHIGVFSSVKIYQEGIVERLKQESGMAIVTPDLAQYRKACLFLDQFEILIIDNGYSHLAEFVQLTKQQKPGLKIIVLNLLDDDQSIIQCMEYGVDGIISKQESLADLMDCIQTVINNKKRYNPDAIQQLIGRFSHNNYTGEKKHLESLTGRQKNVLELVEMGYSNKQIARTLGIEVATVKNHVHSILEKLEVSSRCEAAAFFRRQNSNGPTYRAS